MFFTKAITISFVSVLTVIASVVGLLAFKAVNFHNDLLNEKFDLMLHQQSVQQLQQYRLDHPYKLFLVKKLSWFDVGSFIGYNEPDVEAAPNLIFHQLLESSSFLKLAEEMLEKAFQDNTIEFTSLVFDMVLKGFAKLGLWAQTYWSHFLAAFIILRCALVYFRGEDEDNTNEDSASENKTGGAKKLLFWFAFVMLGGFFVKSLVNGFLKSASATTLPEVLAKEIIANTVMLLYQSWLCKRFDIVTNIGRKLNRNILITGALRCGEISIMKLTPSPLWTKYFVQVVIPSIERSLIFDNVSSFSYILLVQTLQQLAFRVLLPLGFRILSFVLSSTPLIILTVVAVAGWYFFLK